MTGANDYTIDKLESGLTVLTAPMPSARSVTVMVMVGSREADTKRKRINGLSHFMEHMFFKGAKRYPDAMAVASAIDSIGGVFNAFTAEEKVAYFVKLSAAKKENRLRCVVRHVARFALSTPRRSTGKEASL